MRIRVRRHPVVLPDQGYQRPEHARYDEETGELSEDALALSGSVSEEDKDSVIESAEEYYKETVVNMTEEEIETLKTNMNALASIFGEDLTDRFAEWDLTVNG